MQNESTYHAEKEVTQQKSIFSMGVFLFSRCLFLNELWLEKSAEYILIYIYLISQAAHSDRPRYNGHYYKVGELITDYAALSNHLQYQRGYLAVPPSVELIINILDYLVDANLIKVVKKPRGLMVTILDYKHYQTLDYYRTSILTDSLTLDIFEHWNRVNIVKHKINQKIVSGIKKALTLYSPMEIKEAIINYAQILKNEKNTFSYKMPLHVFLASSKGLKFFLAENNLKGSESATKYSGK